MRKKQILVLARRDPTEAMRVAAGLTIYGHGVRLVFMGRPLTEAEATSDHADLLELSDVVPETTVAEMGAHLAWLSPAALAEAIISVDLVVNI